MIPEAATGERATELAAACDEAWALGRGAARGAPAGVRVSVVVPLARATLADLVDDARLGALWAWDARALGDPISVVARGATASADDGPGLAREVDGWLGGLIDHGRDAPPPRVLAALPFDAADTRESAWGPLARGVATLPRWTMTDDGGRRSLRLIATAHELERPLPPWAPPRRARAPRVTGRSGGDDGYLSLVARALLALTPEVTKLVVARAIELSLREPVTAEQALAALGETSGLATFAVAAGARAFVGATPERLVLRRGARIESEALAGTRRAGDGGALTLSDKDRREQEIVRAAITARLVDLGARVAPAEAATERAAGSVVHLTTRVSATLDGGPSALALARALSPTPAVSGHPAGHALAWLRAHEAPRGLYAGPVGWVEAGGDGHFVVGIRSALLSGARVHAWVGAGVVDGSSPARELDETRWKAETLLGLLGLDR